MIISNKLKSFVEFIKATRKIHIIILLMMLIGSIAVRLLFISHDSNDMNRFLIRWYDYIKRYGIDIGFSNYPPLYLYIIALITYIPIPKIIAIKLISIFFDLIAAFTVFLIVKLKYRNSIIPVYAFMTVLIAPTVFVNSTLWGQCDVIFTSFLLISIYCLMTDKSELAFLCYGIAFSFKVQAIFLFPLFFILIIKKKVKFLYFFIIPITYFISIIPSYLAGRPLSDLLLIYLKQADSYDKLTLNAPNIYQMISNDYFDVFYLLGIIFTLLIIGVLFFYFYKNKIEIDNEVIINISMVSVLILPYFLPKMHERYFFAADVISIVLAYYSPKYIFVPIVVGLSSLTGYIPELIRNEISNQEYKEILKQILLVLKIESVGILTIIVKLTIDFFKNTKRKVNEGNNDLV
jgi:Gpi18-like mannosyltransferase